MESRRIGGSQGWHHQATPSIDKKKEKRATAAAIKGMQSSQKLGGGVKSLEDRATEGSSNKKIERVFNRRAYKSPGLIVI